MPAKPEWLLRLPDIRAELEHLDVPVVDRAGIERIFGLKRRRAIELLHQFGGYQAGRTFLLDRARLLEALHSLESREDYSVEKRRRERLRDHGVTYEETAGVYAFRLEGADLEDEAAKKQLYEHIHLLNCLFGRRRTMKLDGEGSDIAE